MSISYIKGNMWLQLLLLLIVSLSLFTEISLASQKRIIYIYDDEGVSSDSLKHTIYTLKQHVSEKYKIKLINASSIIYSDWMKNTALILIPGGADLPYAKKLNGQGNNKIREYVSKGGSYLGICAGSYYGASTIEFDKDGPLEVVGKRDLAFFKGKAIGPAIAKYDYKTNTGARSPQIKTNFDGVSNNLFVYYNGGPYFEEPELSPYITVLARYLDSNALNLPAILGIKYGKGKVVLSGVHFEYSIDILDKNDIYNKQYLPKLLKSEKERNIMSREIFKFLNIVVKN